MSAVPKSGQTVVNLEFLMSLRMKHLGAIRFGIRRALSKTDGR